MLNPFAKSFSLDQFESKPTSSSSLSNQESALTDCHFFMSGVCNKGNLCQFRHSESAKQAGPFAQTCDEWLTYNCWDAECPRKHPARKANPNETICWFFVNQTCSHGDRCHFIHPVVDKTVKDKNKTKQISLDELDMSANKVPPRQASRTQPKKGAILSFSLADLEEDAPPVRKNSPPKQETKRVRTFSNFASGNSQQALQEPIPARAKQQVEAPPAKKSPPPRATKATVSPKTPAPAEDKAPPAQNATKKASPQKPRTTPTTKANISPPSTTKTITPGKRKRTESSESTQQNKKAKITPKSAAKPSAKPASKVSEEDEELAFLEGLI